MRKAILLLLILLSLSQAAFAGEMIAYSRLTDGYWQIWVVEANGENKKQITFSQEDKRDPGWTEDGKKIAFRTNNSELFTIDLDGSHQERILEKYGVIASPTFSKKTNEIVFVRFDPRLTDVSDIWKSDGEGKNVVLLTKDNKPKFQPCFSPDGGKIVFVKADDDRKNYHLWLMSASRGQSDGQNAAQITQGKGFDTLPDFSPDGETIAFTSNRGGDFDIYTVDLGTKKVAQLTNNSSLDTSSSFSPDGERIVFVSNRSGNQQIWLVNKDGSGLNQLTFEKDDSVDPAWGEIK